MTTAIKPKTTPVPMISAKGLEGVVALESVLSLVDGHAGELLYRGYHLLDLAEHTTFEEVAYLLWNGKLPNRGELEELNAQLRAEREIPAEVYDVLRSTPVDLFMLNGEQPGQMAIRTFDLCLILHADHGLNASTFTARVVGSTLSDIYSAITAAIGALKGPLHGGANIDVMKALLEIRKNGSDPGDFIRQKLARKERVMGFGHRVYKTMDPRATSLREMLNKLSDEKGDYYWLDTAVSMMDTMKSQKGLDPNVDFFSAPVYYLLGISLDLYTPIFVVSRVSGWTAHLLEQWKDNRLIRPRAAYIGRKGLKVMPIDDR